MRAGIRHLIYPVPNPDLPFLGIHLTHEVNNRLSVGPNAVLGLSREGLPRFSVNLRDCWDIISFGGFWRFLKGNLRSGLSEMRNSLFTSAYLRECHKYMPSLKRSDLQARKAGVRAQVVMDDGRIEHDFLVLTTPRMVHICNAPSPAATSSLAIADHILDSYYVTCRPCLALKARMFKGPQRPLEGSYQPAIASAAAWAIASSSGGIPPATPTAPITSPFFTIGTPPAKAISDWRCEVSMP